MQREDALAEFRIVLGGIVISIVTADSKEVFTVDPTRQRFSTTYQADIIFRTHYSDTLPSYRFEEKIFASEGLWDLFRSGNKYVLCCKSDVDKAADRMAVFSPDFQSGDIYINRQKTGSVFPYGYPLEYPLDEVMVINLFSFGLGILIHACGIKNNDRGILFIGNSGAGKSTIANLWKREKDNIILSDDRIIVRKKEKQFWIYGTPWHGDANACSPERTPLDKLFFLKHAKRNTVREMTPAEAISRLLTCSFPTFWNKKGMKFTLDFCAELTEKIPCYELGFVPDRSILDFVRSRV